MRSQNAKGIAILAVLLAVALAIAGTSPMGVTPDSARLVSIQELPDVGEMCL